MKTDKSSNTRSETITTYSLRDRASGRLARMEIEDNYALGRQECGEETCLLTLEDGYPFFEVKDLRKIIALRSENVGWYNSSRERPRWNDLDPRKMDVVAIERTLVYDGPEDSDPVEERKTVQSHAVPEFCDGVRLSSRRLPAPLIRRYFDVSLTPEQLASSDFVLVSFDSRPNPEDVIGLLLDPGHTFSDTGVIEAIVDLPEDSPISDRGSDHMENGKHIMLALLNTGTERFDLEPSRDVSFRP